MQNSSQELEQIAQAVEQREIYCLILLRESELSLVGGGTGDISLG